MSPFRASRPQPSCLPTRPRVPLRSSLWLVAAGLLTAQVLAAPQASQSASPWRDPSPHHVRWITVDSSVRLEILDWKGSGPPLVLLGCYLTAHSYDDFAPKLTNQFHVYGLTRRGIGASDKPATGYAVQRSVDDLLEVLDALKAQKSLLVGTSCAGQVLTMFAAHHSDRLSGLVYLDGASDPTTPPFDPPLPDPPTVPRPLKPTPEPGPRDGAAPAQADTGARPQLVQRVHQTVRSASHFSRS